MPDPIAGATGQVAAPAVPPAPAPTTAPPDQFGQDTFLKLMVAQLKYQNPMSPMDSSEFMAQTAQFTTVEKLTELTEALGASLANDRLGTATGMIGREVTVATIGGEVTTTVTGVRVLPTGAQLVLADGTEAGLAEVVAVHQAG